jgi:hypothetical protein
MSFSISFYWLFIRDKLMSLKFFKVIFKDQEFLLFTVYINAVNTVIQYGKQSDRSE